MNGILRLLALLFLLPTATLAQNFPTPLSDHISDYADVVDPDTEARIVEILSATRAETGVHITVATIVRRADYGDSTRIEDFAKDWFNAWGIGDPVKHDGILMLIAVEDREMRIALGGGYSVIYDGRAQRVIDTAILPAFRLDKFSEGIEAGVVSATERLARPFAAQDVVTETSGFPETPQDNSLPVWMFMIAVVGALVLMVRRKIADAMVRTRRCPECGKHGLSRHRSVIAPATASAEGSGIEKTTCSNCSYRDETRHIIPFTPSRNSGRGGFGGGRSSGGGATGRW